MVLTSLSVMLRLCLGPKWQHMAAQRTKTTPFIGCIKRQTEGSPMEEETEIIKQVQRSRILSGRFVLAQSSPGDQLADRPTPVCHQYYSTPYLSSYNPPGTPPPPSSHTGNLVWYSATAKPGARLASGGCTTFQCSFSACLPALPSPLPVPPAPGASSPVSLPTFGPQQWRTWILLTCCQRWPNPNPNLPAPSLFQGLARAKLSSCCCCFLLNSALFNKAAFNSPAVLHSGSCTDHNK